MFIRERAATWKSQHMSGGGSVEAAGQSKAAAGTLKMTSQIPQTSFVLSQTSDGDKYAQIIMLFGEKQKEKQQIMRAEAD